MIIQRLRVTFARDESLKYISHLDMMRLWERALRRAEVPIVYSEGFSPHPQISLAAPLPVGVTSDAELMDVYLRLAISPYLFMKQVGPKLPSGLDVKAVAQVGLRQPSLQSQLRFIDYQVGIETTKAALEIERAIDGFLATEQLIWQRHRDTGVREYDLRATVAHLRLVEATPGRALLSMRLRSDPTITGRAEDACAALGFEEHPFLLHRVALVLASSPQPSHLRRRF